jgi:Na+/proline symporter
MPTVKKSTTPQKSTMPTVRVCDPTDPGTRRRRSKRAAKKKGPLSGLVASGMAITVMMFAMGFFPRVNAFFSNLDDTLRSHNDAIVAAIIQYFPVLLVAVGFAGLLAVVYSHFSKSRRMKPQAKSRA